ncbi:hypothetical protein O6H91_02G130300 [Diphasiastrum complanatum]|nr:hypothetical protein O6H91_02G130300 [Diphasiastrum complanatum]
MGDVSSVKTSKVLQFLGADNQEQELEIRRMVEGPPPHSLQFFISDDSDSEKIFPLESPTGVQMADGVEPFPFMSTPPLRSTPRSPVGQQALARMPQATVSNKDERRKSDSNLSPKLLVRFTSEAADLPGRQVDDRLLDPFYDSRSMSPTPSSQLSPRADSVYSPPERSFTSTPQLSPKGKNVPVSPLASPRRAHPLPTPPSTPPRRFEQTSRPGTPNLSSKPFPVSLPFPLPLPLPPSQSNISAGYGRPDRELRSPLPSPCASPNSYQPSPISSPFRSPHRSTCTSPPRSPAQSPTRLSQWPRKWKRGQELGRGSFGTVYEGMNPEDGSFFAVKISNDENISSEIQQEVNILSQLQHPNIVRYLGTSVEDGFLCIFLELMKCSLQSLLKKYKRFEEDTIRSYTRQILYGLEYLHRQKRVHRDIKCANILVDVNGQVKLADFGVAREVNNLMASSVKGTPIYMAPEVISPSPNRSYGLPADIWSLGCTVLEMADGKPPWSHLPPFGFVFKVSRGELPPIPEDLSPEAQDFILSCLKLKPQDRPSASELLQHRFVANAPPTTPFSALGSPRTSISLHSPSSMHEPARSWSVEGLGRNRDVIEANLRSILTETLPKHSVSSPRNSYPGISEAQHMWHNLSRSSSDIDLEPRDEELQGFHL